MIKLKHKKDGFPKPSFYTDIFYKTNAFLSITVFAISRFFAITLIGVWRVSLRNDDNIMRKSSPSSTAINISLAYDSILLNASFVYTCVYRIFFFLFFFIFFLIFIIFILLFSFLYYS